MSLLTPFSSTLRSHSMPWTAARCIVQQSQQSTSFSTSAHLQARKKGGPKKDPRITQIRYHLQHGLTPRPLRFSRNRALRHWTIHRAWQRLQDVRRKAQDFELERQYNAMRDACEALRLIDDSGMTKEEAEKIGATRKGGVMGQKGNEEGRLYRIAMMKEEIWDGVPIEYARLQVETPGREGWNHGWTR